MPRTIAFRALLGILALGCGRAMAAAAEPPAPDYAQPGSWAAWPGQPSGADSLPQGLEDPALPASERVDVFFIHPTTDLSFGIGNARYDEAGGTRARLERGVLRYQASVFNGCCRIYAPRYRQASIGTFFKADEPSAQAVFALAYADVLRAFEYYLAHENHGRPFILASHSQGSLHALRLLQERIVGTPVQQQLVVAYVVGYYVPEDLAARDLPVCRTARQTGCLADWNTVKQGSEDRERQNRGLIWRDGRYQHDAGRAPLCVNPLNWEVGASAAATLNRGALPAGSSAGLLPALLPQLTGARCNAGRLEVDIPMSQRAHFSDVLSLFGSYHVFDYNLFYANIRLNAKERVLAFLGDEHR
jgi:Protein of unknown function (DUF3089)